MDLDEITKLNNICHQKRMGLIYCLSFGLSFYCFVDFGNHIIEMIDNSDLKSILLKT